jgi:hypothetical protein
MDPKDRHMEDSDLCLFAPPNEAAMLLYGSLKGEAEEELEWCDVSKTNDVRGIDVEALRQPLTTKAIYLKRRYLHENENGYSGENTHRMPK